jgi:hypothetical protein
MPYAYAPSINHVFDTNHLNLYLTFSHPMKRTSDPLAEPVVYDVMPPLEKWLLEAGEIPLAAVASEWIDEYTLLLTSDEILAEPTGVTLEYDGPNAGLMYKWGKQIEPWGPLESYAGYPQMPKPHKSTHENGGSDEISLTGLSGENIWPQRATMFHDESTVITGNALRFSIYTTQKYNYREYQYTPANANSFSNSFVIKNGTYSITFCGKTGSDFGKIDWYLDGVKIIEGQDWYSAASAENVEKTTINIAITTNGYHRLIGTVNGKNDSSTSYYIALTKYWLKPTADPARV